MHRIPTLGMRIVKTSLSVMLCLLVAHWLKYPPPVYACIAAIVVTRENFIESFHQSVARVISTLVGCLFGLVVMLVNIQNEYLYILIAGAGCALTIYFCTLIKQPTAAGLSAIIYLSLVVSHPDDKYTFAFTRLVETVAGIVIAIGVNVLLKKRGHPHNAGPNAEENPPDSESSL